VNIEHLIGFAVTAIGATWVLRSKLSDIEKALVGHVERDDERHKGLDGRIVSLEDWRNNRGRR
jgi:hypothetical protein